MKIKIKKLIIIMVVIVAIILYIMISWMGPGPYKTMVQWWANQEKDFQPSGQVVKVVRDGVDSDDQFVVVKTVSPSLTTKEPDKDRILWFYRKIGSKYMILRFQINRDPIQIRYPKNRADQVARMKLLITKAHDGWLLEVRADDLPETLRLRIVDPNGIDAELN